MIEISVRELKTRTSEIVRNLRKRRSRYIVTYRSRPVALLTLLEELLPGPAADQAGQSAWDELSRLGEEIGRRWRSSQTSAELISEMRR